MKRIILFDGVCNLCDRSVQFIIKRDPNGFYKFAPLQSKVGKDLLKQYGIRDDFTSIVLIEDDKFYLKSAAAIRISSNLTGAWKLLKILKLLPISVRDSLYDIIARNRYYWFGKKDSCMLPSPDIRNRFLE